VGVSRHRGDAGGWIFRAGEGRAMYLPFGLSVFAVGAAALAVLTLAAGVKIVPQGYVFTVERFGRYARSLGAGLALIVPFVERVGRRVNVMEQVIDVPSQQAFTRDNAGVTIDAVVFYQVLDAARASYEVSNLDLAATTLTMTNIRTVVGGMDLDQLLAHRDEINERLLRVMDAAASPWGVKINRIEIKDILLPPDLAGAMARQMKAEREKRASILEAEGQRAAEILRAEGRKQSAILESEGRKEAAFRDAEARPSRRAISRRRIFWWPRSMSTRCGRSPPRRTSGWSWCRSKRRLWPAPSGASANSPARCSARVRRRGQGRRPTSRRGPEWWSIRWRSSRRSGRPGAG
jgi:regulator of protease activity HflC (stomatin/prohibitin superfamily)